MIGKGGGGRDMIVCFSGWMYFLREGREVGKGGDVLGVCLVFGLE